MRERLNGKFIRPQRQDIANLRVIPPLDLGWLIGLLEGEGCFRHATGTQRIQLGSVDKDVIEKFVRIVYALSKVKYEMYYRLEVSENRQPVYEVTITGLVARAIMRLILPHMSERRRQRITMSLKLIDWEHIPKGWKLNENLQHSDSETA